jgi:putative methionine-R-sulfoxide reductase with GAF domain
MNRREAESALKHRSYFCCPLIHENSKVGLLYMDSTEKNAFNEGSQMAVLEKAMSVLAPLVSKTLDDLSAIALQIEVE